MLSKVQVSGLLQEFLHVHNVDGGAVVLQAKTVGGVNERSYDLVAFVTIGTLKHLNEHGGVLKELDWLYKSCCFYLQVNETFRIIIH